MRKVLAIVVLCAFSLSMLATRAAHAATVNIYPTFHAFQYPASVVGKPFYWQLGGGEGSYIPPADDRYYSSNNGGPKNSNSQAIFFDTFEYHVKPIGVYASSLGTGSAVASYTVSTFNSSDDAQQMNSVDRSNNRTPEGGALMPLISLAHPALPTEWARLNTDSGSNSCVVTTGLVYHNLLLETTVISQNSREGGQPACTNEIRYVEKVERLMVTTAAQAPTDD